MVWQLDNGIDVLIESLIINITSEDTSRDEEEAYLKVDVFQHSF